MDREILFRGKVSGKRLNKGEWIEGNLVHQLDFYGKPCDKYFILNKYDTNDYEIGEPIQVDPATVGQFTGLCDKNGKKIFEGDVVGCWDIYHENYAKGEVIKKITGEWLFYPYLQHGRFWSLFSNDIGECPVEVIGNIHDTPDLAKEESE